MQRRTSSAKIMKLVNHGPARKELFCCNGGKIYAREPQATLATASSIAAAVVHAPSDANEDLPARFCMSVKQEPRDDSSASTGVSKPALARAGVIGSATCGAIAGLSLKLCRYKQTMVVAACRCHYFIVRWQRLCLLLLLPRVLAALCRSE